MMPFVEVVPHSSFESDTPRLTRPKFNHQNTQDRLREAAKRPSPFSMISNIRKDRRSVFTEVGLAPGEGGAMEKLDEKQAVAMAEEPGQVHTPAPMASDTAEKSNTTAHVDEQSEDMNDMPDKCEQPSGEPVVRRRTSHETSRSTTVSAHSTGHKTPWYAKLAAGRRPRVRTVGSPPPSPLHGLSAVSMLALTLAVLIPFTGKGQQDTVGVADAGPIVLTRADSPTVACARWAMQCRWCCPIFEAHRRV